MCASSRTPPPTVSGMNTSLPGVGPKLASALVAAAGDAKEFLITLESKLHFV